MDWDKELADGGDADTASVADTKMEPVDLDMREAEVEAKSKDIDTQDPVLSPLHVGLLGNQDVKMDDPPLSPPSVRPISAGSSASFVHPPPPSTVSAFTQSTLTAHPMPPPRQDPPVELSARERNRLKRKRKPGTAAFVAGATAPSGNSLHHTNGASGPSGPPPPPKGAASKYGTVAAGEAGSSK